MTALYIANATRQIHQFCYRHPTTGKAIVQKIEIGGQVKLVGIETAPQADQVIQDNEPYGLISIAAVERMRDRFSGLCYSIDREVDIEKLRNAMNKHIQGLVKMGEEIRKEAALSVNNEIEGNFNSNPNAPGNLSGFEMSVIEQEPRGGYHGDHKPFGETVRVTREDAADTQGRSALRAPRARKR